MYPDTILTNIEHHQVGLERIRRKWGWFLALGLILVVFGMVALGMATFMTLATMLFVGWIMIAGGVLQALHAFSCKHWSGFFVDLLAGLLYTVVGFMIVANPAVAAITLTLVIAILLIFGGIFRVVVALSVRYPNRPWLLLNGVINLMLGVSIWLQWPLTGLWVIGLFVGIDMILNGWSLVMLALAIKNLPGNEQAVTQ